MWPLLLSPSSKAFLVPSLCGIVTFVLAFTGQNTIAADFTLEQIRATITDSVTSIHSLHAIYSSTTTTKYSATANPKVATWNYECWIEGRKSVLAVRVDDNEHPLSTIKAYDGDWTQSAILTVDINGTPSKLQRYRGYHSEQLTSSDFAIAAGLQLPNTPGSIVDAIQGDSFLVGEEVVANARCVKIEFPRISGHGKGVWKGVAAFDVDHQFVLRDLQWFAHPEHPIFESFTKNYGDRAFYSIHIDEVSSVTDGTDGSSRWLPKHATTKKVVQTSEVRITSGEVNVAIPKDQFTVVPEFGAEVFEGESANDPAGRRWIAGGENAVQEHRARAVERARQVSEQRKIPAIQPASAAVPSVNASPQTSFPYWWCLAAVSAGLIAAGVFIARRT